MWQLLSPLDCVSSRLSIALRLNWNNLNISPQGSLVLAWCWVPCDDEKILSGKSADPFHSFWNVLKLRIYSVIHLWCSLSFLIVPIIYPQAYGIARIVQTDVISIRCTWCEFTLWLIANFCCFPTNEVPIYLLDYSNFGRKTISQTLPSIWTLLWERTQEMWILSLS